MTKYPLNGRFEEAAEAVARTSPHALLPEIAQTSIAISLKRIADMMESRQNILNEATNEAMIND